MPQPTEVHRTKRSIPQSYRDKAVDLEVPSQRRLLPRRRDHGHAIQRGVTSALSGLLVLVVLLLVVAVRNTWDLLVTIADRPDAGRNRRCLSDVEKDLAHG